MFRNTFVSGFVSLFYSLGSNPLELWRVIGADESVEIVHDETLGSNVLQLRDPEVQNTRIECPAKPLETLALAGMPYLVLILKQLEHDAHVSLELELLDDSGTMRRFRFSSFQREPQSTPTMTLMPLELEPGWNTVTLHLPTLVQVAHRTRFRELGAIIIHANTRLRRIYLAQELVAEENLPVEFRLIKPS